MKHRMAMLKHDMKLNWSVYVMVLPVLLYYIIFAYFPMGGVIMAFQNYNPTMGILKSPWIGLKNFFDFFGSYYCGRVIWNTFMISLVTLVFSFPCPIMLALMLNEVINKRFKSAVQTLSYMPYFISLVVMAGLVKSFTAQDGFITTFLVKFGVRARDLLSDPSMFRSIYVASDIWQNIGFGSIIYLAALSGVDQELYEAAVLDGAGRWRQTWHITLPGISATIIIMLILRLGQMFNVGYEKIILLYSPITYSTADVISSFTYREGLLNGSYGYAASVGLFNSAVNLAMLLIANVFCRKFTETSLF